MPRAVCQEAIDLIKSFEQCRLTAYLPTPHDRWTVGWGDTGPDVIEGLTITQVDADQRLDRRLNGFSAELEQALPADLGDHAYGACIAISYNIGAHAFENSTLCHLINQGDLTGASEQFPRWNKQAGIVLPGLVRRRAAEQTLFLLPDA